MFILRYHSYRSTTAQLPTSPKRGVSIMTYVV